MEPTKLPRLNLLSLANAHTEGEYVEAVCGKVSDSGLVDDLDNGLGGVPDFFDCSPECVHDERDFSFVSGWNEKVGRLMGTDLGSTSSYGG